MTHTQLIAFMVRLGVPTSPFMHYWTLKELLHYHETHTHSTDLPQTIPTPS